MTQTFHRSMPEHVATSSKLSSPGRSFGQLDAIAAAIEPFEAEWVAAWNELLGPSASCRLECLRSAAASLNAAIAPLVEDVARITGNSSDSLRWAYRPRDEFSCWFSATAGFLPSRFLRNVAKHRSFNTNYWWEADRREEQQAMARQASPTPPASPEAAAFLIAAGGVPTVMPAVAERVGSRASMLEQHLFLTGVLDTYWPGDGERWRRLREPGFPVGQHLSSLTCNLSATRSFGYLVSEADGVRLVFWPVGRTANHCKIELTHKAEIAGLGEMDDAQEKAPPAVPRC